MCFGIIACSALGVKSVLVSVIILVFIKVMIFVYIKQESLGRVLEALS